MLKWMPVDTEDLAKAVAALAASGDAETAAELQRAIDIHGTESEVEAQYVDAAVREHHRDGEVEVDRESPTVSLSEDGGAYVLAWVWVGDGDAGVDADEFAWVAEEVG